MIPRLCGLLLICAVLTPLWADGPADPEWRIDHWTVAAGGAVSLGGEADEWQLAGTFGQWSASSPRELAADGWRLTGGFWGFAVGPLRDLLFRDRFQQALQTAGFGDETARSNGGH